MGLIRPSCRQLQEYKKVQFTIRLCVPCRYLRWLLQGLDLKPGSALYPLATRNAPIMPSGT